MEKNDNPKALNTYLKYSGLAFQMVALIGLATWGGLWLDKQFNTQPIITIILILAAIFGSMIWVVRAVSEKKENT